MADGITREAELSSDGRYRWWLTRRWGKGPLLHWVMLNPSIADGTRDDPTIRRCMGFANGWGLPGIIVTNLFARVTTKPAELWHWATWLDPVGVDNDTYLLAAADAAQVTVCAWGSHTKAETRARHVLQILHSQGTVTKALRVSARTGMPGHPLYLPGNSQLIDYPEVRT